MKAVKKIAVNLTRLNIASRVEAIQGDGGTRCMEVTLLSNGKPIRHGEGSSSLHPAAKINVITEVYV